MMVVQSDLIMQRTCNTISIVTRPADGMPAAPTAARVAVSATMTVPAAPRTTPWACESEPNRREGRGAGAAGVFGLKTLPTVQSAARSMGSQPGAQSQRFRGYDAGCGR